MKNLECQFAEIIIDISSEALDRPFTYRIPPELEERIYPGAVVKIPFGNQDRLRKGYVIRITDTASLEPERIKSVHSVETTEETADSRLISLAYWMKETYGSTMIQALRTVFPVQRQVREERKKLLIRKAAPEKIEEVLSGLSPLREKGRIRVLEALKENVRLDYTEAVRNLKLNTSILRFLEREGLAGIETAEDWDEAEASADDSGMPADLTPDQEEALRQITSEWMHEHPRPVLLKGVTGSGKTRVYMELIRRELEQGRQVIVLIPEIALTYQTVRRFYACFGEQVSVINSRLSAGERQERFRKARNGEISIMVGPRSALFTPFERLGLIIIDEEHESSYQSEHSPRYHARETALWRGQTEGARILLGSATPSLEAYTKALRGEYCLAELQSRVQGRLLPEVRIVDMREELRRGNRQPVSMPLRDALEDCLAAGEQAMLFLNRRGYASFVSCRSCGEVMKCPHCDVSLTEHNGGWLVCHYCGWKRPMVTACPVCGSAWIGGFRAGTQQIESSLYKILPAARVLRMDFDTTRKKGSYEEILRSFAAHEADILVGTQMIVKGHDFPKVTLVGALASDLALFGGDYRSSERTFQLLTQAAGRAGRGEKPGKAFFQTYHPDHYCIRTAAAQDYEAFYRHEMGYRTLMDYPPAAVMMAVLGASEDGERLKTAMDFVRRFIERLIREKDVTLIGPAPASVGKIRDTYHMVLYLKTHDSRILGSIRRKLDEYIEINHGFQGIYIQYEVQL